MNLETALEPPLWNAVRASIEARKYTAAVLDAIHFLTDVIRERSGLEGDGVALVGAAFGGNSPKLKVNRLQTESEQNVQRGVEAMLRGLYQAVRNPRSHDSIQDNERDAKALLVLVDYLLRIVGKSGSPFSVSTIVHRVLDPDFVPSPRYASLLVGEIPAKKRLAVFREVFARRADLDRDKAKFFFAALLSLMAPEETSEVCEVLSQELRETDDEGTIRFVLGVFPGSLWVKLDELARLRIENKLIAQVRDGKFLRRLNRCAAGALGTWVSGIVPSLTLKDEFGWAIARKLESGNTEEQDYVFSYFGSLLPLCFPTPPPRLVRCATNGLKAGDKRFRALVSSWTWGDNLTVRPPTDPWTQPFVELLTNFVEAPETPVTEAADGGDPIPF